MPMWIRRSLLLLPLLALLLLALAYALLRGSVPIDDGELALPGLSAPVTISRDASGMVDIEAANETDMARALGFVHGQERFFEMDLTRRAAAGARSRAARLRRACGACRAERCESPWWSPVAPRILAPGGDRHNPPGVQAPAVPRSARRASTMKHSASQAAPSPMAASTSLR